MTDMKSFFTRTGVEWPDLEWINTDSIVHDKNLPEVPDGNPSPFLSPVDEFALHFTGDQLCFLQYTSGSTSAPKGVMIPWSSLTHNMKTIVSSLEADDSTVVVSWLPQYHDMGLIGSLLSMLYISFLFASDSFTPLRRLRRVLLSLALHPQPPSLALTRI